MKIIKALIGLVVVVGVLLIVTVIGIFVFVDSLAKQGIEKGTSYALAVPTTLQRADVGITTGSFDMEGLNVANPEGFDTPHFMNLDSAGVAVSFESLSKDVVELPSLTLDGIDVNLQKTGNGSNYGVILENLKRFESEGDDAASKDSEGKKFIIKKVTITNIVVHAALLPIGGDATKLDLKVPEIILTDVGSGADGGGVPMGKLAAIIVKAVFSAVVEKAGGLLPADMLGDLTGGLGQLTSLGDMGIGMAAQAAEELGDIAGQITDEVGDVAADAQKAAEGAVEDATDKAKDAVDDAKDKAEDAIKGILGGGGG